MYINKIKFIPQRFSSGELKLKDEYLNSFIRNNQVEILFENNTISFLELFAIINYYKAKNLKVNLILGYLPYQRMNHKNSTETETIKYISNVFNSLKLNTLQVCEPHCSLEYFNNAVSINLVERIYNRVKVLINFDANKDLIIFTDKGAKEKFSYLGKNHIYGQKTRDALTGLVSKYELSGNIESNQKIIIVDDIVSSGDTIIEALDKISNITKNKVYIVCAHYENNKYNKRLINNKQVEKIFSSNSLKKQGNAKIKLFKLKDLIYE